MKRRKAEQFEIFCSDSFGNTTQSKVAYADKGPPTHPSGNTGGMFQNFRDAAVPFYSVHQR